jgi:hypothetical protein
MGDSEFWRTMAGLAFVVLVATMAWRYFRRR